MREGDPPPDPKVEALVRRLSNWGRWGADDELGTLNLVTPAKRVEAAACVRKGESFPLAIAFDLHGPQPGDDRRVNPRHLMLQTGTELYAGVQEHSVGGWGYADDQVTVALHGATHWDSLAHIFWDYRMYNDRDCRLVGVTGAERNGIENVGGRMVTRGVLVDVPRHLGVDWLALDHHVTVSEIEGALERQRVEVRPGDVLLVRTGNLKRARRNGGWEDYVYTDEPGIGLDELPWLHAHDIAAVGTDTWGFEVLPSGTSLWFPLHAVAVVHMGMMLGEMFDLEALAEDCARDGVYEFLFCGVPLPITRAVAGPVAPVAVK